MAKAMPAPKKIEFRAMPGVRDGMTCLSIYPPGEWMDSPDFCVFVGGGGVGHTKTRKQAEALLLSKAKEYCTRRMSEAQRVIDHYAAELKRLDDNGLEPQR